MEHVDEHLPVMNPEWNNEILRDTNEVNGLPPIPGSSNVGTVPNAMDPTQVGEKRALTTPEGPPAKRARILPEEAGRSTYQMKGLVMSEGGYTPVRAGTAADSKVLAGRLMSQDSVISEISVNSPPRDDIESPGSSPPVAAGIISETVDVQTTYGNDVDTSLGENRPEVVLTGTEDSKPKQKTVLPGKVKTKMKTQKNKDKGKDKKVKMLEEKAIKKLKEKAIKKPKDKKKKLSIQQFTLPKKPKVSSPPSKPIVDIVSNVMVAGEKKKKKKKKFKTPAFIENVEAPEPLTVDIPKPGKVKKIKTKGELKSPKKSPRITVLSPIAPRSPKFPVAPKSPKSPKRPKSPRSPRSPRSPGRSKSPRSPGRSPVKSVAKSPLKSPKITKPAKKIKTPRLSKEGKTLGRPKKNKKVRSLMNNHVEELSKEHVDNCGTSVVPRL